MGVQPDAEAVQLRLREALAALAQRADPRLDVQRPSKNRGGHEHDTMVVGPGPDVTFFFFLYICGRRSGPSVHIPRESIKLSTNQGIQGIDINRHGTCVIHILKKGADRGSAVRKYILAMEGLTAHRPNRLQALRSTKRNSGVTAKNNDSN